MAARIHFIERLGNMKKLSPDGTLWESGWWVVSEETAEKLKGGEIYFHKNQGKPSFFGGVIQSYRVETEGELKGRLLFTFRTEADKYRDVMAGTDGWGMEKKIVL